MKTTALVSIILLILLPAAGMARQPDDRTGDVRIELVKENEFVVKVLKAIDTSGKKITQIAGLDSFNSVEKVFLFKNNKAKIQKIPAEKVKEIAFILLRQGVLTGKPQSLRVIAWNSEIKAFELAYRDVRIKDGSLYLNQAVVSNLFDDSDMLRTNSQEWSDKLYKYWARVKNESPEVFAAHFGYKNGRGTMTRKIAADYCKACVNIEILRMQINPADETILIRSKAVFYDRWNE